MPSSAEGLGAVKTDKNRCVDIDNARKPLARLRCLKECMDSLKSNAPLPKALCYIPAEVEYVPSKSVKLPIYSSPAKDKTKLSEIVCTTGHSLMVSGEELFTSEGHWAKLVKVIHEAKEVSLGDTDGERWVLLYSKDASASEQPRSSSSSPSGSSDVQFVPVLGSKTSSITNWEDVVEHEYALRLSNVCRIASEDSAAVDRMREVPANWTMMHYDQLTQLLCSIGSEHKDGSTGLGDVKEYVESIDVSTQSDEDGPQNLTDSNSGTFWESDGNIGSHWIRLKMKPGTIVRNLTVVVDSNDENYLPRRIIVMGGELSNLRKLTDTTVDCSSDGINDIVVMSDQTDHLPYIEIRIKECQEGGIDTRVHGIKIKSSREKELGLNRDTLADKTLLMQYPKLEGCDIGVLYRKAMLLKRFLKLLDSVLPFLVPRWEYSVASYANLEVVRELLPLSKKRIQLVEQFLRESESSVPGSTRKVYIDRRSAMEHRNDPTADPDCKNSVFCQLFEGLKPREGSHKALDYRWPARHSQWWECKFMGEGIIDQGGGFRDSISDISEELCPSSSDSPVPLPFFIRTPNQTNIDASNYRDLYIPNPSCTQFHKYEWIGKLMGACFRGKENLILSLPSFVWKMLCGQPVTWQHDFIRIDEAQLKLIESMRGMVEDAFSEYFGGELMWTVTLSNGSVVHLKPLNSDGSVPHVAYSDRLEYARLVEEARMNECKPQIEAVQKGLLQVIPQAALELFTWHEVEKRICGDPEITIEALRKHITLSELQADEVKVKYLWEVLEKFSNDERSRFLRFVTGRRRLPTSVHVTGIEDRDVLPTSSTCGNTLYLPHYSSADVMLDKLRYAVYNCISIDTDTNPNSYDNDY